MNLSKVELEGIIDALMTGGGILRRNPLDMGCNMDIFESDDTRIYYSTLSGSVPYSGNILPMESGIFRYAGIELRYRFLRKDIVKTMYSRRVGSKLSWYNPFTLDCETDCCDDIRLEMTETELRLELREAIEDYLYHIGVGEQCISWFKYSEPASPEVLSLYESSMMGKEKVEGFYILKDVEPEILLDKAIIKEGEYNSRITWRELTGRSRNFWFSEKEYVRYRYVYAIPDNLDLRNDFIIDKIFILVLKFLNDGYYEYHNIIDRIIKTDYLYDFYDEEFIHNDLLEEPDSAMDLMVEDIFNVCGEYADDEIMEGYKENGKKYEYDGECIDDKELGEYCTNDCIGNINEDESDLDFDEEGPCNCKDEDTED